MAESLEYRKYKLKKHRANISNRFEVANRKLDKRSSLIKYPWKVFAFIFKNILYGFNYIDYTLSFIKRNQFDVDFLEYQILTRGMDTDEAISFLEEQNIWLKDFVYRNKMTPEYQSKAIRSLDLLFSKYNVIKDSEEKSFISNT